MTHKKIMKKCSKKLMKDAEHYEKDSKHSHSKLKKKHDLKEKSEAISAARYLKEKSKKAHEY